MPMDFASVEQVCLLSEFFLCCTCTLLIESVIDLFSTLMETCSCSKEYCCECGHDVLLLHSECRAPCLYSWSLLPFQPDGYLLSLLLARPPHSAGTVNHVVISRSLISHSSLLPVHLRVVAATLVYAQ